MQSKLLPAPFETDCIDYKPLGFLNAHDCMEKCLKSRTIESFDKMPFSVILNDTFENTNKKEVSLNDLMNETNSRTYVQIERECTEKCHRSDCQFDISMTTVNYDEFTGNSIKFEIGVPKQPLFVLEYNEDTSLEEFIIYSSSIVSVWFGFCIMSFNPFDTIRKKITVVKDEEKSKVNQGLNLNSDIYQLPNKSIKHCCITTRNLLRKEVAAHNYRLAKMLFMAAQYRSLSSVARIGKHHKYPINFANRLGN